MIEYGTCKIYLKKKKSNFILTYYLTIITGTNL